MVETDAKVELIQSLHKKEAYDHPVEFITMRETHISWVFLTGHYVYKIKKPVNFGFLDFSTLERRKYYCEEEIRLNRRLAPGLYLAVVPICGSQSAPKINGHGSVLEYAVIMRQFEPGMEFDELLARDELTKEHMKETAQVLANFHSRIDIADCQSPYGTPKSIYLPILENFEQIGQLGDDLLNRYQLKNTLGKIQQWSETQFHQLEKIFQGRKKNGFIRECHGDLHLRNIVIYKQRVTPFDGIEFNSNLRWIDVMSELAFLIMDIEDHNRVELSRHLLNKYLEITGDYKGLEILLFYKVYRAMVRAKVAGLQLLQLNNSSKPENESLVNETCNYIELASNYTIPTTPKLIISHGLSGSGKSTLARLLSGQTDIICLRSDIERKRIFGLEDTMRDKTGINEGIYSSQASIKTYDRLLQLASITINAGYSTIIDAAFLKKKQRQVFYDYANTINIPFLILHSKIDLNVQRQRLIIRQQQDLDASDADNKILNEQLAHHDPLTNSEKSYSITIDTTHDLNLSDTIDWLENNN